MDFSDKMAQVNRLVDNGHYAQAVIAAGTLLETLLLSLYNDVFPRRNVLKDISGHTVNMAKSIDIVADVFGIHFHQPASQCQFAEPFRRDEVVLIAVYLAGAGLACSIRAKAVHLFGMVCQQVLDDGILTHTRWASQHE